MMHGLDIFGFTIVNLVSNYPILNLFQHSWVYGRNL